MDETERETQLGLLTDAIERAVGRRITTPKDFTFLRNAIYARTRLLLSQSTLMRVWDYIPRGATREATLTTLVRFLGYRSWAEFQQLASEPGGSDTSGYLLGRHLDVGDELTEGDRIVLIWRPGRRCEAVYLGDFTFRVISSEQTRLRSGDTFCCRLIIEDEPLYLDRLIQTGRPTPGLYLIGKISGVRFELCPAVM